MSWRFNCSVFVVLNCQVNSSICRLFGICANTEVSAFLQQQVLLRWFVLYAKMLQRIVGNEFAFINDDHAIADGLHLLQYVGRK